MMSNSFLANAGIVVIDDKQEEVKELFDVFHKQGIPWLYYDGENATLPESPLLRVRLVFADLNLFGINISGNDGVKNAASKIAGILEKIISKENGPYALVYWSSHSDPEIKEEFEKKLSEYCIANAPVLYCDMDKAQCLRVNKDRIAYITNKLHDKLKDVSALQLYTDWEGIVVQSAAECVRELSNSVNRANWSVETGKLFHHLYKQYVGKRDVNDNAQKFRYAAFVMDMIFSDILDKNIGGSLELPNGFSVQQGGGVDFDIKSKLNAALFITYQESAKKNTGDVFCIKNPNKTQEDILKSVKKGTVRDNCPHEPELAVCVITPGCDFAQNKCLVKENENEQMLRVIYGLLYQVEKENDMTTVTDTFKKGDAIFSIQPFFHEDKHCALVFNFHSLASVWSDDAVFEKTYKFSLKTKIRLDLQSKAAQHVNRLGHFDLG